MRFSMSMAAFTPMALENFWSLLKRGIDEQTFRYKYRNDRNDYDLFELALSQITGKRLTYEHLTGKDREADTAVI